MTKRIEARPLSHKFSAALLALSLILAWSFTTVVQAADAQRGKQLFADNACAKCHAVTPEEGVKPGPSLVGIGSNRDRVWLKKFIRDPKQFKTDPAVRAEMKKFPIGMPASKLGEPELEDVLAYLDQLK